MRKISFYHNRGLLYVKVIPTSYRDGDKILKKDNMIYLGRVIDRDKKIFYSKDRGLFRFDEKNKNFSEVTEKDYDIRLPIG